MEEQEITSEDVAKDTFPAPPTEHSLYKHSLKSRVRTYDVDRQNIVHNAVNPDLLETPRVEKFR